MPRGAGTPPQWGPPREALRTARRSSLSGTSDGASRPRGGTPAKTAGMVMVDGLDLHAALDVPELRR